MMRLAPLALAATVLLAACGGGGGAADAPATSTLSSVPVTVIDGAIGNALVCLDQNVNGACDPGEPSGRTDASGNVVLQVPPADVGKYPVIAVVGTDAIDADHGPVPTPFTMKAPADKSAVVSPLTTLVQASMEATGSTSAVAEAAVQNQIGLNVSLFQDFTKGATPESATLGTIARMVVVTTQEQVKVLAGSVGIAGLDGAAITQAEIDKAIQQRLLEALPEVVAAANDPSVQTGGTVAMTTLAQGVVQQSGLTTVTLTIQIQIAKAPDTSSETPLAGGNLHTLTYTDANNWFRRSMSQTVAQATPDSAGLTRYSDRRQRSASGVLTNWSSIGNDPSGMAAIFWTGSAWTNCPFNFESVQTTRDANGRTSYVYCKGMESGVSQRTTVDISGRSLVDVYDQIRAAGYTNLSIANSATALAGVSFPAGSKLFYQVNTPTSVAYNYSPVLGSMAGVTTTAAASGQQAACSAISTSTPAGTYTAYATSLAQLVAAHRGTPCVYAAGSVTNPNSGVSYSSGSRNEWWGQSTVNVGILGSAPLGAQNATGYHTSNTFLRIGFGDGDAVKYYSCRQRVTDGSPRNCDLLGTGTYTIQTLGDAKLMTLNNQPALFAMLNYQRTLFERGGRVWLGGQSRLTPMSSARLNLPAMNALSAKLGLPAVDPDVPQALTAESYQGHWIFGAAGQVTQYAGLLLQAAADGSADICTDIETNTSDVCFLTITPATGAFTLTLTDGVATGTLNLHTSRATAVFDPTDPAEPNEDIEAIRRF